VRLRNIHIIVVKIEVIYFLELYFFSLSKWIDVKLVFKFMG